ncbi:MAG: hemopexin repeat-containing protein [Bacteroidota bacterium]
MATPNFMNARIICTTFLLFALIISLQAQDYAQGLLDYGNGKVYAFRETQYLRYSKSVGSVDAGYPQQTSIHWQGMLAKNVDAAVYDESKPGWKKAYFFTGNSFYRFDKSKNRTDSGYPRRIVDEWKGLPNKKVDAVISLQNGSMYFFYGDICYKFNRKTEQVFPGYPRKIAAEFKGLPGNLDAGVYFMDTDNIYFFKKTQYYRVNKNRLSVDPGYPKVTTQYWKEIDKLYRQRTVSQAFGSKEVRLKVQRIKINKQTESSKDEPYMLQIKFRGKIGAKATVSVVPYFDHTTFYKRAKRPSSNWAVSGASWPLGNLGTSFQNLQPYEFIGTVSVLMEKDKSSIPDISAFAREIKKCVQGALDRQTPGSSPNFADRSNTNQRFIVERTGKAIHNALSQVLTSNTNGFYSIGGAFKRKIDKVGDTDDLLMSFGCFYINAPTLSDAAVSQLFPSKFYQARGPFKFGSGYKGASLALGVGQAVANSYEIQCFLEVK